MKSVTYVGPSPGVEVHTPDGYVGFIKNVPAEVSDSLASSLLTQDTFEAGKAKNAAKENA